MALQKAVQLPTGISGDYQRIVSVQYDAVNRVADFTVGLYLDAAARMCGRTIISTSTFSVEGADFTKCDIVALGYEWLKTLPEMSGAKDV